MVNVIEHCFVVIRESKIVLHNKGGRILHTEVFDHLLPWLSKPTIMNTVWCGQKIVKKTKIL